MLLFEQYDEDTWGIEWGDYLCLIKRAISYTLTIDNPILLIVGQGRKDK